MFILLKFNESSFRFMFSCDSLSFFFHNHHVPTKETSVYSTFGGAQRAIEMCYRNLSPCEFSELFPGTVLQILYKWNAFFVVIINMCFRKEKSPDFMNWGIVIITYCHRLSYKDWNGSPCPDGCSLLIPIFQSLLCAGVSPIIFPDTW